MFPVSYLRRTIPLLLTRARAFDSGVPTTHCVAVKLPGMSLRLLVKLWSNVFTKPQHEDALEFTIELPGVSIKDIDAEMLLLQDTSFVTNSRLYIFKGG